MGTQIFTNITSIVNVRKSSGFLRGKELAALPCLNNAYLIIEDNVIAEFGSMENEGFTGNHVTEMVEGTMILPAWCDSHTHLVFAGSREEEFVNKIKGLSYAEIAAGGGGILNSANKLNNTSEDILFCEAWKRLEEVSKLGTGAIEIKSG